MSTQLKSCSGKFVLRISPTLHQAMIVRATREGLSLNKMCERVLLEYSQPDWIQPLEKSFSHHFLGVVLFGSQARGTARQTSDVDILIVFDPEFVIDRKLYRELERILPEELHSNLSFQCVSISEKIDKPSAFWLEIAQDGKILSDKTGRILARLNQLKETIARGIYRKQYSHGQGYWMKVG